MSVQLYGMFEGFTSIPNVSRAIATELKRKHVKFTIYAHGSIIPKYDNAPWPVALNSSAHVGIFIGYPTSAENWLKSHTVKVLITVCETNQIPSEWVKVCNDVDYVVVPSRFCRQVFMDSGVRKPVIIAPHGVEDFGVRYEPVSEYVNFLHVTGAISFPHRKGTPALLVAWKKIAEEWPKAHLYLKMWRDPRMVAYIEKLGLERVRIDDTQSLPPIGMANYLNLFDAVIQPSRGEGFGMVPLEARVIGVPTIITSIAGHSEHYAPGVDTEVPVGPYKPLITQGNENGFAPSVEAHHIEVAVRNFMNDRARICESTRVWAERFRDLWSWKNTLKPLMKIVLPLAKKKAKTIKLGDSIGIRGA